MSFASVCVHHLLPFFGHADLAYLPGERLAGLSKIARVVDATDDEGARDRIRRVLIDSGLAARVFGLNPRAMTDDEVDDATSAYRLVRLDLIDRCSEDPADLRWVWLPVAAGAAFLRFTSVLQRPQAQR